MPSSTTLRLRFNEDATKLIPVIEEALADLLINLNAPLTPLAKELDAIQHTPLDIDVTPQDNSNTKKESVSYTYKGFDGYAPIVAYMGQEGWCMGLELRPGSQHSQNNFIPFLNTVIHQYFRQFLPSISGACSVARYLLATQGCPRLAIKYQPLFTGLAPRELSPRKTVHSIDTQSPSFYTKLFIASVR